MSASATAERRRGRGWPARARSGRPSGWSPCPRTTSTSSWRPRASARPRSTPLPTCPQVPPSTSDASSTSGSCWTRAARTTTLTSAPSSRSCASRGCSPWRRTTTSRRWSAPSSATAATSPSPTARRRRTTGSPVAGPAPSARTTPTSTAPSTDRPPTRSTTPGDPQMTDHTPTAPTAADAPETRIALVPDDDELLASIHAAGDLLATLVYANDPDTPADERWDLPAAVSDERVDAAYDRLAAALTRQITAPGSDDEHGELRGPTTGLMPLRLAHVDPADVALVADALAVCQRALDTTAPRPTDQTDRHQLRDLAELLEQIADPPEHGAERRAAAIIPLMQLVGVLQIEQDADFRTLVGALHGRTGDVTLTHDQEQAYRRLAKRYVTLLALSQGPHVRHLTYWAWTA